MGFVLNVIEQTSDNRVTAFNTQKRYIDETEHDTVSSGDDHEISSEIPTDKFAETNPVKNDEKPYHVIPKAAVKAKFDKSNFKLFLDGSRHVYKTGDILISGKMYPIVVGQIIVGVCTRESRQMLNYEYERQIVLVVPSSYDWDGHGDNYYELRKKEINAKLAEFYKDKERGFELSFDKVLPYDINGKNDGGRNKYLHKAITKVQNQMMDLERETLRQICLKNQLDDSTWMVKDGTLQYRHDLTNKKDEDRRILDEALYDSNMQNVIGVSKMFDPELLFRADRNIGQIIAKCPAGSRTNAYRYIHEGIEYCVWYLRLREGYSSSAYSDVVKVEFIMISGDTPSSSKIDIISAHLLNEANPVCFGKDARWGNHIYPVYITEQFAKNKYINDNLIINMI